MKQPKEPNGAATPLEKSEEGGTPTKPAATDAKVSGTPVSFQLTDDGPRYRFKVPAYIVPGSRRRITSIEALGEPAELERLVMVKSGVIEEI